MNNLWCKTFIFANLILIETIESNNYVNRIAFYSLKPFSDTFFCASFITIIQLISKCYIIYSIQIIYDMKLNAILQIELFHSFICKGVGPCSCSRNDFYTYQLLQDNCWTFVVLDSKQMVQCDNLKHDKYFIVNICFFLLSTNSMKYLHIFILICWNIYRRIVKWKYIIFIIIFCSIWYLPGGNHPYSFDVVW